MAALEIIAGGIAIGQAAAAGRHVVRLIKNLPEIKNEYDALQRETQILRMLAERAFSLTRGPRDQILWVATANAQQLIGDIEEMMEKCSRDSNADEFRQASKMKWTLERSNLQKLREQATKAESRLNNAMLFSMLQHGQREQSLRDRAHWDESRNEMVQLKGAFEGLRLQLEVGTQAAISDSECEDPIVEEVERLSLLTEPQVNMMSSSSHTTEAAVQIDTDQLQSSANTKRVAEHSSTLATALSLGFEPMTWSGCTRRCRCRCHFYWADYRIPEFAEPVLGSWSIKVRETKCNIQGGCKGRERGRVNIGFRRPRWLTAAMSRVTYSLRLPRVIPSNDDVWHIIDQPLSTIHQFFESGVMFFPNDTAKFNTGLVEYALGKHAWDFLDVVLNILWKDLLVQEKLPRMVFFRANSLLNLPSLGQRELALVKRALSCVEGVEDVEEARRTGVHEAVITGGDLHEALVREPWALEKLDHFGLAPIHYAIFKPGLVALDTLLVAGANVDQKNYRGLTPLVFALYKNLGCIQRLLQASTKRSLELKTSNGMTALHFAVQYSSPAAVAALLRQGASTGARDDDGQVPVHKLALSAHDEATVTETLRLLQSHKETDLEARDKDGRTPILEAVSRDNLPALRALVTAGASLHATAPQWNLLHLAAGNSSVETLQFLLEQNLVGINHYHGAANNASPLDSLAWVFYAADWQLGSERRPSESEIQLFTQLFCQVRNGNAQKTIDSLSRAVEGITRQDAKASFGALAPVIKQSEDWDNDQLLYQCQLVQEHINEGEWDMAANVIAESIDELREEMRQDPWEKLLRRHDDEGTDDDEAT